VPWAHSSAARFALEISAANIKRVVTLPGCIAAALVALIPLASAQVPATPVFVPVAHSALLSVDGAVTAQTLWLRVRHAQDRQPVNGAELAVTIDGRSVRGTVRPDGTWAAALPELPAGAPGEIEIVVAHDGVREVLEGQIPRSGTPPAADSAAGRGGGAGFLGTLMHKQASWWILNVLIVVIGVIAVSRRMS
jgi:hypothetical protein